MRGEENDLSDRSCCAAVKGGNAMKKTNPAMDYANSAFRYWAERGCISYSDAVKGLVTGIDDSDAMERALNSESPRLLDILACERTFRAFEDAGRHVVCDAVRAVYMASPWKNPARKEVTARIVAFARSAYVSESQVKRYLAAAREEFARNRGLRWE